MPVVAMDNLALCEGLARVGGEQAHEVHVEFDRRITLVRFVAFTPPPIAGLLSRRCVCAVHAADALRHPSRPQSGRNAPPWAPNPPDVFHTIEQVAGGMCPLHCRGLLWIMIASGFVRMAKPSAQLATLSARCRRAADPRSSVALFPVTKFAHHRALRHSAAFGRSVDSRGRRYELNAAGKKRW